MSEIYEMNIDEIEKYIIGKKIKDMSLEEIRNFIETQGNTIILNHHIYEKQQLEIERLNENNQAMQEEIARTWKKLDEKENIIKEVREWANKTIFYFDFEEEITTHAFDLLYTKQGQELLEILDKENK